MENYGQKYGFGVYPVTIVNNYIHHLKDGTKIAMRLWLPWLPTSKSTNLTDLCNDVQVLYKGQEIDENKHETFPVIMEYIPYGKDAAGFLDRDYGRHSWFASHGYVCCRPDMRGCGSSDGFLPGEYTEVELNDGIELIEWLSLENWCNGSIGLYGKSWGGFNGLQLGYLQPNALKTAISLYSTDDRYTDDIHYKGDCILGNVDCMVGWASVMQAYQARPPVPKYQGNWDMEEWKKAWQNRLENQPSLLKDWVTNQRKQDPIWRHGSINEDYSRIKCPMLIIGGLLDPYHTAAFRMAAYLNDQSKAIIGPWPHQWPDYSQYGPNIDYLNVCLDWWDRHLKGIVRSTMNPVAESVDQWPRLQVFIQGSHEPDSQLTTMPGYWTSLENWKKLFAEFNDTKSFSNSNVTEFVLGENSLLETRKDSTNSEAVINLDMNPNLFSGLHCGAWMVLDRDDISTDQSLDNKSSTVFVSKPLEENLVICGLLRIHLTVESLSKNSQIAIRLCHELKSGKSTLISFGIQNMQKDITNDEICIDLNSVTYAIPKGDKILLAFSPMYFPMVVPSQDIMSGNTKNKKIKILKSLIRFQTPVPSEYAVHEGFSKPSHPLLNIFREGITQPKYRMFATIELNTDKVSLEAQSSRGPIRYPNHDLIHSDKEEDSIGLDSDFKCCKMKSFRMIDQSFPNYEISTRVEAELQMEVFYDKFVISSKLITKLDDEVFFSNVNSEIVDRKYV